MKTIKIFTIIFLAISLTFTSCKKDDDSCTESIWYEDSDGDGFGNLNSTLSSCTQPTNYVSNSDDVDDSDANLNPNTVWQGSIITFTKVNNADWALESNQDRISSNVWITRANGQGIFNIVSENNYTDFSSPSDTEWAFGTTTNIGSLTFDNWEDAHDSEPPSIVNQNMVLHLITDNIYIDIKFTTWTTGDGNGNSGGGGFSYERSTMN